MQNKFKLKNVNIALTDVRELVDLEGKIKVDPCSNPRLGYDFDGRVSLHQSSEDIIKQSVKLTLDNNSDKKWLTKDIVEEGFDIAKQNITAVDIVDYLKGDENRYNIVKVYHDDAEFVNKSNRIIDVWEDKNLSQEKAEEELKDFRDKYYVVAGGNTRWAIIMNYYYKNPEAFKDVNVQLPINIINYSYYKLVIENMLNKVEGGTCEHSKIRKFVYQLAYFVLAFADNAKSGIKNNGSKNLDASRGVIARKALNISSYLNNISEKCTVKEKLCAFKDLFQNGNVNSIPALLKGLLYVNTVSSMNLEKDDELDYALKNIATILGDNLMKSRIRTKRFCKIIGLDWQDLSICDQKLFQEYLEFIENIHAMESYKGKSPTYVGKYFISSLDSIDVINKGTIDTYYNKVLRLAKKGDAEQIQASKAIVKQIDQWLKNSTPTGSVVVDAKDLMNIKKMLSNKKGNR